MSKQTDKYHLGMAGEYFVAAELHRCGIAAAVTHGNAKKADVVAVSPDRDRSLVLEVKTTAQPKWVLGQRVPEPSDQLCTRLSAFRRRRDPDLLCSHTVGPSWNSRPQR